MNSLCQICGVQRPVHYKFWMPSQIRSIWRSGTSITNAFNCCRLCSSECWVEPPPPHGAPAANTCFICGEQRPGHRQYWMPSQVRSIWHYGSSVTSEFNCCRLCNPSCWTPIAGSVHMASPRDSHSVEPVPPPPPPLMPPPAREHPTATFQSPPPSPPLWPSLRQPPPPPRQRRLEDKCIRESIGDSQELVPAAFLEIMVTRVKLPLRDKLCALGACLVPHTTEGLEALRLSMGGINLRGEWVDYSTAVDCVQRYDIPIFLDPGNAVVSTTGMAAIDHLEQIYESRKDR